MNPLLNEREQECVRAARAAAQESVAPLADRIDRDSHCPRALLEQLGEAGVLVFEGPNALLELALTVEEVARVSPAVATLVGVHGAASLFLAGLDMAAGAGLLTMAAGDGQLAVMTEAEDGSMRLDGELSLVPGASTAERFLVVAGADEQECLFLIGGQTAGLCVGPEADLLGLRGAGIANVALEGVTVTSEARVGDATAVQTVGDYGRVAQAARAVGVAQSALDHALAEVGRRRDAGDRIDRSQSIQWMLADIATETEAARVSTWHAATRTPGAELSETAAGCRLLAAEAAVRGARRAVQVFGGRGMLRSAGVERIYRDAKLMEIEGGTNEEQLRRVAAHLLPMEPEPSWTGR